MHTSTWQSSFHCDKYQIANPIILKLSRLTHKSGIILDDKDLITIIKLFKLFSETDNVQG
jgi:hypothetical protein